MHVFHLVIQPTVIYLSEILKYERKELTKDFHPIIAYNMKN